MKNIRRLIADIVLAILILCSSTITLFGKTPVVVDSMTLQPVSNVTVFDRNGSVVGVTNNGGHLPYLSDGNFPIVVRMLGYREKMIEKAGVDTIFMEQSIFELPEVVVDSHKHRYLHLVAYVRDYSIMTTYSDTIFMFREKMVDFLTAHEAKPKVRGWTKPRVLSSQSFYRFSNQAGLDSVSDRCNQHFSWTDWVGILPPMALPERLREAENATDTVKGKYSPVEVWNRKDSSVRILVDVLAGESGRKWVPGLSLFFKENVDFDRVIVDYCFEDVIGNDLLPRDLKAYSVLIESRGRGRNMFMFNKYYEPFFVTTYSEVYIVEREYITQKEAAKWSSLKMEDATIPILVPAEAPDLDVSVQTLIARVKDINHNAIRLAIKPDMRYVRLPREKLNFGQAVLGRIKGMLGLDMVNANRKWARKYSGFRKERLKKNKIKSE